MAPPASRGPARDQRTAHSRRRADQADDDLAGCDPRFLRARLSASRRTCCPGGTLRCGFKPPERVPSICSAREYLRHQPLGNDRLGLRHGPKDYAAWLAGGEKSESMAAAGRAASSTTTPATIATCPTVRPRPSLVGIFGKPEKLADGETRMVDEGLIRQALIESRIQFRWRDTRRSCQHSRDNYRGTDFAADCLREVARPARKGERQMRRPLQISTRLRPNRASII